jgi:hypothetical protein
LFLAVGCFACGDNFQPNEGSGGGSSSGSGGSSSGSGGSEPGCADGTRERYEDRDAFPNIAGCRGAWSVPGVSTDESKAPVCGRQAGNSGEVPSGVGCSVADLCAKGWHVCRSAVDVGASSGGLGCPEVDSGPELWLTRQTSVAMSIACSDVQTDNNLIGCGDMGEDADGSCAPLERVVFFSHCVEAGWSCGTSDQGNREAALVTKSQPLDGGGVLCCRD